MEFFDLNILQIVGPKNGGKTRHAEWLISALRQKGFKVGALKHSGHTHAIDRPGSDSFRLQSAGANPTAFWSANGLAVFYPQVEEQTAFQWLGTIFKDVDLLIIESFAAAEAPKIVIDPDGQNWQQFNRVLAVVSQQPLKISMPLFKPFDKRLIDFVMEHFHLTA